MGCIVETKAATVLQFVHGLRGSVHVTLLGRNISIEEDLIDYLFNSGENASVAFPIWHAG
jgi:hypothetical protein